MRLQFLFLQLSGRAQILHARAFNRAIEFERGLIVVLKPDWRAEVDAEVEAIVGRKRSEAHSLVPRPTRRPCR
jgi:hypothetical protein